MASISGDATGMDSLGPRAGACGGCLLLLFVVLLLASLPVLLRTLGVVLGLAAAIVSAGIIHGAVQHHGGWRALLEGIAQTLTKPFRSGGE